MRFLLFLCVALSLGALAQDDRLGPVPEVPEGVRWNAPEPEQEYLVAAWLERMLAADYAGEESLFGQTALVGPVLWDRLKTRMIIDPSDDLPTSFSIPRVERGLIAEGRGLQSPASIEAFENSLRERLAADGGFTVRRLTGPELEILDALWGFDLEGPLLALETPQRRMLVVFVRNRPFAFFELSPEIHTREQEIAALAALETTVEEPSPRSNLLTSEELPSPPPDPGGPSSVILVTDQEMVAARMDLAVFQLYIDRLEAILEANPQEGRFMAQIDFDPSGKTLVRTTNGNLEEQLATVATPPTRGPVSFILVKDY